MRGSGGDRGHRIRSLLLFSAQSGRGEKKRLENYNGRHWGLGDMPRSR